MDQRHVTAETADQTAYEAPELRILGSIEEWTSAGGSALITISVILP